MKVVSKVQPKVQPKSLTPGEELLAAYFGSSEAATLIWSALVSDANGDVDVAYAQVLQITGSGTPAITRGSAMSALMDSGYFHEYAANLPAYEGRVVENVVNNSSSTPILWSLNIGSASGWTLTGGQTDPNGGSLATKIETTTGLGVKYRGDTTEFTTGDDVLQSMWIKLVSGTGTLSFMTDGGTYTDITAQVTSSWKRFAVSSTYAGITYNGIAWDGDVAEIHVAFPQSEIRNASADKTIPGEYVPTTGNDPVAKTFSTTNGNTVASNVVTEGTGTELTTWGMRIAPEHTNNLLQSNNFNTTWYKSNATISASTNIFGTGTSNTKIAATASARCIVRQSLAQQVSKNVWRIFFEKEASQQDRIPIVFMLDPAFTDGWYFGVNPYTGDIEVETASGTPSNDWAGGAYRVKMNDAGKHWEFLFESSPLSTAGFYIWIEPGYLNYPALTTTGGATAGDWVIASEVEEFFNTTIEQVEGSPPIVTTTAPLGTDPQQSEWAAANFDGTSDFAISMELEGNVGDGTELLIHSDTTDGSTTFTDSSSNNATITPSGTSKHSTNKSEFGATAIYFPVDTDYISLPDSDTYYFGTRDFTIEFFIARTTTGFERIMGHGTGTAYTSRSFYLDISSGNVIRGAFTDGLTSELVTGITTITDTDFHHVAVVREGVSLKLYLDGELDTDHTIPANYDIRNTAGNLEIGRFTASSGFVGYIDEVRIVNGFAKYSGQTFTPPDAPFADPEPLVPNPILATEDTDTVLLIHSDTFDGDTDFEDSSYLGRTLTPVGTAAHDTAVSQFGSSSIYTPATNANYIKSNQCVVDTTTDFTLEMFVKSAAGSNNYLISHGELAFTSHANNNFYIVGNATGSISFAMKYGTSTIQLTSNSNSVMDNTLNHVAVVRSGDTVTMFIDGVAGATTMDLTGITVNTSNQYWQIGTWAAQASLDAHFDEIRFINEAVYTANFTPPTAPFDRGTLAQYEMAYIDASGNLVLEDQGGAKATAPLSAGNNKCGIFKESGNLGVTVGGTTGTLVASSNNVGGNGKVLAGHGVTSPILMKNLLGYTGGSLQTQMETNTA